MNKSFLSFQICRQLMTQGIMNAVTTNFYYGKKDQVLYASKDIYTGITRFEAVYIKAFTDADLNDFMPDKIFMDKNDSRARVYDLVLRKKRSGSWVCSYEDKFSSLGQAEGKTEVEAKAKIILKLKKYFQ